MEDVIAKKKPNKRDAIECDARAITLFGRLGARRETSEAEYLRLIRAQFGWEEDAR